MSDSAMSSQERANCFAASLEYWDELYGSDVTGVDRRVVHRTSLEAVEEDRAYTATQDPYSRWKHLTMPAMGLFEATVELLRCIGAAGRARQAMPAMAGSFRDHRDGPRQVSGRRARALWRELLGWPTARPQCGRRSRLEGPSRQHRRRWRSHQRYRRSCRQA